MQQPVQQHAGGKQVRRARLCWLCKKFLLEQYVVAGVPADASACAATAEVMAARLGPSSWQPYSSIFGMFVRFCLGINASFLPATPLTGLRWAQHLAAQGTVKAGTSQPYFSAVNTVHAMLGHPRPCADNPLLASFRKGWARQQVPVEPAPPVAGLALPARMAFAFYTVLPSLTAPAALRPVLFSLLSYLLILRPASLLSVRWLRVSGGMLQYQPLHWKGKLLPQPVAPVLQFPVEGLPLFGPCSGAAGGRRWWPWQFVAVPG